MPVLDVVWPAVLALGVAFAGAWGLRRRQAWAGVVAGAGVAAGWLALGGRVWGVGWPRGLLEVLPGAAGGVVLGAAVAAWMPRLGRVAGFAGVMSGAWWVAGSAAGRAEFWRVGFAVLALSWWFGRVGAGAGGRAVAVGLVLFGGVLAAVAGIWSVAGLVLAGAGLGLAVVRGGAALPAGLLAVGVVAVDLGAGRLVQGRVGVVDLVCCGAVIAGPLVGWAERGLARRGRIGRALTWCAPVAVAVGVAGAALLAGRVLAGR